MLRFFNLGVKEHSDFEMLFCELQARSQVGALGARAPPAILVHPLALLSAPPIGIEYSKGSVKF